MTKCKHPDMPYDGCDCLDLDGNCLAEEFYIGDCVFDAGFRKGIMDNIREACKGKGGKP